MSEFYCLLVEASESGKAETVLKTGTCKAKVPADLVLGDYTQLLAFLRELLLVWVRLHEWLHASFTPFSVLPLSLMSEYGGFSSPSTALQYSLQ